MVEKIVASMHEEIGVTVETNRWLAPAIGNGTQKREIDVLITTSVAGYPVRLAIECKNEAKLAGSPDLGVFIDKLNYVGIPPQQGSFVSVAGYTKGALERARAAGVRCLTMSEVSKNLTETVIKAFQSILYLLLAIEQVTITNTATPNDTEYQSLGLAFFDTEGDLGATVQDFVWQAWLEGTIPDTIGQHDVSLQAPEGWYQKAGEKRIEVLGISVRVHVRGLIIRYQGSVENYALLDAQTRSLEKWRLNVDFKKPAEPAKVIVVETEDDVETAMATPDSISISIGRIRLPRIIFTGIYWPPSKRAVDALADRLRRFEAGEIADPRPSGLDEIEGTDFATIFEPIWEGHPAGYHDPGKEGVGRQPTYTAQQSGGSNRSTE